MFVDLHDRRGKIQAQLKKDILGEEVYKRFPWAHYDCGGSTTFALPTTTDPTEGWDGSLGGGGSILPQGVYVWRLETLPMYAAEKVEVFGSVTLIK